FEGLLEEYKKLREKERVKLLDMRKEFEKEYAYEQASYQREYEHMEEKLQDALEKLPVKEA
ncbi:MAG: hypothetical protein WBO66_01190, partial [Candidatus Moraniibacteriota bacterium]